MRVLGTSSYVTVYRTRHKGFNAELMRWRPSLNIGGVLLQAFGLRLVAYRDKD